MKLIKIVTHHSKPILASELYFKEGLIAIGYVYDKSVVKGNAKTIKDYYRKNRQELNEQKIGRATSTFLKFRDDISEGDIVFAYQLNNMVGMVGEVKGPLRYKDKNIVGKSDGLIGYPNQREVEWWDAPRNFDRNFLPKNLSKWVSGIGALAIKEFDKGKLLEILKKIPSQTVVTKALEIYDEKEIKDNMERNLGEIEKGLKLIKREYETSDGLMDFLSEDNFGTNVVIEVKTKADDSAVSQIRRYMRAFKRDKNLSNIRGIIVAEKFTKRCIEDVEELKEHNMIINLYRCRKKFEYSKL